MRRAALALSCLLLLATSAHAEWYKAGNLHRSTGEFWHSASTENRVATSADFIAAAKDRLSIAIPNRDELYFQSIELVACVNEVFVDSDLHHLQVSEVAVLCMVQMGWMR